MTDVQRGRSETISPPQNSSRDFVTALQDAVRDNPLSAALVGMGVLWMFMGGSNTSLFGTSGRKSIFRMAAQSVEAVGAAIPEARIGVGSSVGRTSGVVVDTAAQAASAGTDVASHAAARVIDHVSSAYDTTTNVARRGADTISNAASSAGQALQQTAANWGHSVKQNMSDVFERQPLLLGAMGFAIGAGFAASVPTTETEKSLMGDASDFVRNTVMEKATEVKGRVEDMAEAAALEAKAQGFTTETVGDALRTVSDKVGAVIQTETPGASSSSKNSSSRGSKKV